MEFIFDTVYNQKALSTMARALRKTLRKKRSRFSHIFGWVIIVLSILISLPTEGIEMRNVVTWIAAAFIFIVLIWEDQLNGFIAGKRMLPGTSPSKCVFKSDNYFSENTMGSTQWHYENIDVIAENKDYFIFIFNSNHAQAYDKHSISGGDADEFRMFIEQKTGKNTVKI